MFDTIALLCFYVIAVFLGAAAAVRAFDEMKVRHSGNEIGRCDSRFEEEVC